MTLENGYIEWWAEPAVCVGYPPKEAEGDPLEQHLDEEEDGEDHVHNLQDEYQLLVVLQIDVLETQRQTVDEKEGKVLQDFFTITKGPNFVICVHSFPFLHTKLQTVNKGPK